MHAFNAIVQPDDVDTLNDVRLREDVAGEAGITGVATDPFDWGVPTLTFGTFTSAARRRAVAAHRSHLAGRATPGRGRPARTPSGSAASYQQSGQRHASPTRTRAATSRSPGSTPPDGLTTVRGSGQDFADFLLGLPQQATRQYSRVARQHQRSRSSIRGRQMSLFVQDDWRWKARWTINYGVQYRLHRAVHRNERPHGQPRRAPRLHGGRPVVVRRDRAVSAARIRPAWSIADWNNVAPRIGAAWRATQPIGGPVRLRPELQQRVLLDHRAQSVSAAAVLPDRHEPRHARRPADASPNAFANIAREHRHQQLRHRQGLPARADPPVERRLQPRPVPRPGTSARPTSARAARTSTCCARPTAGPTACASTDVQSFTWQSSEGSSHMNGISLPRAEAADARRVRQRVLHARRDRATTRRRPAAARPSRRTTRTSTPSGRCRTSIGATSSAAACSVQLPWGRNRVWLTEGGWLAHDRRRLVDVREPHRAVRHAADGAVFDLRVRRRPRHGRHAARRLHRRCRSSVVRSDHRRSSSTRRRSRFPQPGTFGNSARNMIIGPGSRAAERAVHARRRARRQPQRVDQRERQQPAEHRQLRGRRHQRQLADVRPGRCRCAACARCALNLRFRF